MYRRRVPFDLRAPAAARDVRAAVPAPDGSATAGTSSGMPRFLTSALGNAPAVEAGASDVEMASEPFAGDGASAWAPVPEEVPVRTAAPAVPSVSDGANV